MHVSALHSVSMALYPYPGPTIHGHGTGVGSLIYCDAPYIYK